MTELMIPDSYQIPAIETAKVINDWNLRLINRANQLLDDNLDHVICTISGCTDTEMVKEGVLDILGRDQKWYRLTVYQSRVCTGHAYGEQVQIQELLWESDKPVLGPTIYNVKIRVGEGMADMFGLLSGIIIKSDGTFFRIDSSYPNTVRASKALRILSNKIDVRKPCY